MLRKDFTRPGTPYWPCRIGLFDTFTLSEWIQSAWGRGQDSEMAVSCEGPLLMESRRRSSSSEHVLQVKGHAASGRAYQQHLHSRWSMTLIASILPLEASYCLHTVHSSCLHSNPVLCSNSSLHSNDAHACYYHYQRLYSHKVLGCSLKPVPICSMMEFQQ